MKRVAVLTSGGDAPGMNAAIHAVGGIIDRGGTVLGTNRCPAFLTEAGQAAAVRQLRDRDISGLIVIGGNGSQRGAEAIDRLRVTASAHGHVFRVELMGRKCGYLALVAGLTGGSSVSLAPWPSDEDGGNRTFKLEEKRTCYSKKSAPPMSSAAAPERACSVPRGSCASITSAISS